MNSKLSKLLGLGIFTSVISAGAFAEPPVQAGETLESLSKAKISTTVNGQQASLESLVNSGQIRLVNQPMSAPAQPGQQPQQSVPNQPMPTPGMPVAQPEMPDTNSAPANLESEPSAPATEQEMTMGEAVEQPALEEQQAAAPEAAVMTEQTEIAVEAEADPAVDAPLNAAPEMPAETEATEQ
ncbi:hypothetical protein V3519_04365 [Acinetobacter variabilis]|uniref:hypothetical protein n=1 Tax=Acinetobacter variabilis TaxID=70346 RepID=UPI0030F51A5B